MAQNMRRLEKRLAFCGGTANGHARGRRRLSPSLRDRPQPAHQVAMVEVDGTLSLAMRSVFGELGSLRMATLTW